MIDRIKKVFGFLIIGFVVIGIGFFFVLLVTNDIKFSGKKTYEEKVVVPKETEKVEKEAKKTEEESKKAPEEKAVKEYKIDTDNGHIKGEERKYKYGANNETYYAFQGIPYAKPPIGILRFKNPEPVTPWEDVLDATKEKGICPQKSIPGREPSDVIGTEDCLYLNIYTPHRPDKIQTLLPVMIWFHGGGFQRGSGNTDYYGPDFLIKNDVILVTFNYRLGALGFLNLQITDAPGNLGIKDQLMVLRWIKSNISRFGGDPANVTLFGEDSGASSIQMLTLSKPLRQEDLFHKVILQSGSVVNPWAFTSDNEEDAHKLAKKLGINTLSLDYDKIVEELRAKPIMDIINGQDNIIKPEDIERLKLFAFVPSIENPVNGTENSLITSNPFLSFASGHLEDIPTIAGITNSEANIAFLYYPELITSQLMESLNQVPDSFLPSILKDFDNDMIKSNAKSIVKRFYFKDERITWEKIPEFFKLLSDGFISIGMYMTIEIMKSTPSPLYIYEFSYEGDLNYTGNKVKEIFGMKNENERVKALAASTADGKNNIVAPSNSTASKVDYSKTKISGASHEDELGYLFLVNKHDKEVTKDKHEYQVREQLSLMWTNFAKTTNPNGDKVIVEWPKCTESDPTYLMIGDKFEPKTGNIEENRYFFWYNLFISVFQGDTTVIENYLQSHKLL